MEQINENKSREETLQENATQLFRSLEDHAPDGIFMVDPQTGRLLEVNQNACNSLGYTREELLTMRVSDLDESWRPKE
jgi:PAS domain S-box-containing protein